MINGKIGICVIGSGRAGMIHATNFAKNVPGAELIAVVDPIEEVAKSAAKELGIEGLEPFLSQNTAIAVSKEDAVAPAKVAVEFAKKHEALKIKTGLLDNKLMSKEEIMALAALPSKEVLLAKMLGSLNAPISGLVNVLQGTIRNAVYVLEAVRKQKEENEKKSA